MEGPPPRSAAILLSDFMLLAVMAYALWFPVSCVVYSPYGLGLDSGLLDKGQAVSLCDHVLAAPATQAIHPVNTRNAKLTDQTSAGSYRVESGAQGIVTVDPAWDEDSCDGNRPIAIKLSGGKHKGLEVAVPRKLLRKR